MTRSVLLTVLVCLFATAPAHARAVGKNASLSPARARLLEAARCPALFGSAEQRLANQEARRHSIYWVQEEAEGITVAHSSESWGEPVEIWVKGLELVGAQGSGEDARAVVRVAAALAARLGCPAADYGLSTDDQLGRGLKILVVARTGLLLERSSGLAFVRSPAAAPRWVMAWSAPGKVRVGEGTATERIRLRSSYDE